MAGNTGLSSVVTVTVDNTNPTSAICSVGGNGCTPSGQSANPQQAYSVQSISGTASDTSGSGVTSVNISILDSTTSRYYTGSTFTSISQVYLSAAGTNTWTYSTSGVPFTVGDRYVLNVRSHDLAGNTETAVALTFDVTNSPPTVSNVTASENSSGVVTVGYDVADVESSQTTNYLFYGVGATLNGSLTSGASSITVSSGTYFPSSGTIFINDGSDGVNEIINYSSKSGNVLSGLTRGASNSSALSHNSGVSVYINASSASGTGIGLSNKGTGKTISWTARTDADGYQNATENIIVVANDGSVGSMLGRATNSSTFNLDAAKTTGNSASILINNNDGTLGNVVSSSNVITLKIQNITGSPASENIKVQFSRDGSTWFGANANGTISVDSTSTSFASDSTTIGALSWPWTMASRSETIQVRIIDLYSNGNLSVVDSNTVGFNATPQFDATFGTGGMSVTQISDSNDSHFGQVKIDYKVRDTDNTTATPAFSYDAAGGTSYTTINNSQITGISAAITSTYTQHTVYWTPTAESISSALTKFKVTLDDGEAVVNTTSQTISSIIIDAKIPVVSTPITFDAGEAGISNSATITIPRPADDSSVQYRITDDSITQDKATVVDTGWVNLPSSTSIPWTLDSDIESKTIKYQFRDLYGNTTTLAFASTPTPVAANSFTIQDISNTPTNYYGMYIGWNDPAKIGTYKMEHATSSDNNTYGSYSDVNTVGEIVSDNNGNYHFLDLGLDSTKYYRYRLGVVGGGNTSVRAGAYVTVRPDGVQNFSEGGGGSVATASKVENVVPTQDPNNKTVSVTYKLTDSSNSQKTNLSYEGRIFYNIGITLPLSALTGSNLTVSDASKLGTSGYIQINNEVLQYTGKSGNVLSGIVRATWPGGTRTTRQNATLFAGNQVWVMANTVTPTTITNSTISTGQTGTIVWNTYNDITLNGSSYSNVGVRVLVHDNQAGASGPLSSQNDYSTDATLSTFDLSAPLVAFSQTSGSNPQNVLNPTPFRISLSRVYPINVTVHYNVTGTAVGGGVDYTLASGTATITAGQLYTDVVAPTIIDHNNTRTNKTIIVTLSAPTSSTLGIDTVYIYTIINTQSDTTPPVIVLKGQNPDLSIDSITNPDTPIHIMSGTIFVDPGVDVTDDVDGLCTYTTDQGTPSNGCTYFNQVNVDTNNPGTGQVVYTAIDTSGNRSTDLLRQVIVDDANAVTYLITTDAGAHGNISPMNPSVQTGTDQEFTVTPNTGYKVATISIDGGASLLPSAGVNTYTFTNVLTTHTIAATFSDNLAPVITITGANPASVTRGSSYTDAGAT
ncbi:MAG: hypothetical protein NTX85_02790, partial [Candidatus Nomurabacteria bacterium]|nr:hypothetical protein [Candidatus Nomurabacteria bacterium]